MGVISHYMRTPWMSHLSSVYLILNYVKGASGRGLWYHPHGHIQVEDLSDTDWAGSLDDGTVPQVIIPLLVGI